MSRVWAVVPLVIATLVGGGCGCGDVRLGSSLTMELATPLPTGTYAAEVCIDERGRQRGDNPV